MAGDLTTLDLYKQFAGVTTTDAARDARISAMISSVSQAIATYCARTFDLSTYRQWLDGTGRAYMQLPNWPVKSVFGICLTTRTAATIAYTGSGSWASVSVKGGVMTLFGTSSIGVETTTDIALSSYLTITLLAAYVNTLSGWSMTVQSGQGGGLALNIRDIAGARVTSTDSVDLDVPDDSYSVQVITEGNQTIGLDISGTGADSRLWSGAVQPYANPNWPVRSQQISVFPEGTCNVFAWYRAGYTMPSALSLGTVPADLVLTCNSIVKRAVELVALAADTHGSESIGDYSYTTHNLSTLKDSGANSPIASLVEQNAAALSPHRSMKVN